MSTTTENTQTNLRRTHRSKTTKPPRNPCKKSGRHTATQASEEHNSDCDGAHIEYGNLYEFGLALEVKYITGWDNLPDGFYLCWQLRLGRPF